MQKIVVTTLLFTAVLLTGCFRPPLTENQNANTNTATSTAEQIDMSDWKTYRNEEWGIELLFPKELGVKEKVNAEWVTIELFDNDQDSRFVYSTLPIGVEDAEPVDDLMVDNILFSRSLILRNETPSHLILDSKTGRYFIYSFRSGEELNLFESILSNVKFF